MKQISIDYTAYKAYFETLQPADAIFPPDTPLYQDGETRVVDGKTYQPVKFGEGWVIGIPIEFIHPLCETVRVPLGQRAAKHTGNRRLLSSGIWWQVDLSTYRPMYWWVSEADIERLNPGIAARLYPVQGCAKPPPASVTVELTPELAASVDHSAYLEIKVIDIPQPVISLFDASMVEAKKPA